MTVTMKLGLCIFMYLLQVSSAGRSVEMPFCMDKERCNEMWGAPNISDCIDSFCECTGGSIFVESHKTCMCTDGQVEGTTSCLPASSELGSSCIEDIQCTNLGEHVFCDEGKCGCKKYALNINGTCQKKLLTSLQEHCVDDTQCSESFGDGSHCQTSCVCKDGFYEFNSTKCISYKRQGEECSAASDCYGELTCVEGKCSTRTETATEQTAYKRAGKDAGERHKMSLSFLILLALFHLLNVLIYGSII